MSTVYVQSNTLIFIHCTCKNFMVKRLLQYKTKHASVILQENNHSTRTVLQTKLASGFLHEVSRS